MFFGCFGTSRVSPLTLPSPPEGRGFQRVLGGAVVLWRGFLFWGGTRSAFASRLTGVIGWELSVVGVGVLGWSEPHHLRGEVMGLYFVV